MPADRECQGDWSASAARNGLEAATIPTERKGPSRRLVAAAAAPGVVLCVADGIVRIGVLVLAGEDLRGPLRRGIDVLIGVAPGEHERRDRQDDRDPHSRP